MPQSRESTVTGHAVIWTISGLLCAAVIWSCVGEFDVVSTVRGRVISEGYTKTIQAGVAGSISSIRVREGDTVQVGQVLIELDPTLLEAEAASVRERLLEARAELARLVAERDGRSLRVPEAKEGESDGLQHLAAQRLVLRARQVSYDQRLHEYQAALDSRKAALAGGHSAIQSIERRLAIAREKEQRALPYVDIAVPRFQYLQWKDDLVTLEKEFSAQQLLIQRLARDVEEASQRLLQISSQRDQELSLAAIEKQALVRQLDIELAKAAKRLDEALIRAPEGGVVQKVTPTTIGASVSPQDNLIQLVPSGSQLQLEILIPNEEMGYIQPGHQVDVKFDAFPFQKYGRAKGRLLRISPDAELTTSSRIALLSPAATLRAVGSAAPQYFYRGIVQLEPTPTQMFRVVPGMTAQADIYTDRRRIVDFFLFPTRKWVEEAVRVR